MPKQFVVYNKYGPFSGRIGEAVPRLGGIGVFKERWKIDDFLVKVFAKIHLHGDHDTPLGRKHPSYKRAVKRFERRMAMFSFQNERDY